VRDANAPIGPGALCDQLEALLSASGLSKADQVVAVQLLATRHGLKATSVYAGAALSAAPRPEVGRPSRKVRPPSKVMRSPEEVSLLARLTVVKQQLKASGKQLPSNDPLVVDRDSLLERIKIFRAKGPKGPPNPQSGAESAPDQKG
jgi:hypothetical protein